MRTLIAASTGALVLAGVSHADFVDVVYTGTGAGSSVTVSSPVRNGNVFAGQIRMTLSNSTGIDLNGNWTVFCSDLGQNVSGSSTTYEVLPVSSLPAGSGMGAAKAAAIADLYAFAAGSQLSSGTSNNLATAFQLAIWEIVHDFDANAVNYGLSITSGLFSATKTNGDAFSATLMGHIANLFGAIGNTNGASLIGLGHPGRQDQILEVNGFVPGPGVLASAAIGLLLAGPRRRRA
ncbi:MAG: Cys-Gln thioester bond-forming surface protein [Phycisphaerae bacterium]|nr:Cys-Gln thioester bond-forming surface protein [Phycisphaerae bacterium]